MNTIDLNQLNPQQKKAVCTIDKPVLLLAGAGSGKTRVITYRIAYLISKGVDPKSILALTFTNKAAKEMAERVRHLLKGKFKGITVTTFHSLCVRILRKYIHLLGYQRDFVIFDTTNQQATIKTIYEDEDLDPKVYNPKAVYYEIMKIKGEGKGPEHFLDQKLDPFAQTTGFIFKEYNKTLKGCNAVDFEDILFLTMKLIKRFPEELAPLKKQYEYIMVDEYQDTNRVQYNLVQYLATQYQKICVVGDDDQSIYGWRGADIRNILDFKKDFPATETIKLEQNYRSTNTILSAANSVIANNENRMAKDLWTDGNKGDKIDWIVENTPKDELTEVVSRMRAYKYSRGVLWSEFAFLYRSNFQSRAIEEQLRNEGIPYQLIGGTKFFDRKEIQDCIAYMRFFHNLKDEVSLLRVINYPRRDLGKNTIMVLTKSRIERNLSLFEMMEQADELEVLKPRAKKSIRSFVNLVYSYQKRIIEEPFWEVFKDFFTQIDMKGEIEKQEKNDRIRETRVTNFFEFLNTLYLYGDRRKGEGASANLIDFLDYVSLFTDSDKHDETVDQVSLFTVHSAKGLEFNYVAIVGLNEGQFPNQRTLDDAHQTGDYNAEEERRLFYVAITRAKKVLTLSMSKTRMLYGELKYNMPSRFIEEIDQTLLRSPDIIESDPLEAERERMSARGRFFDKFK
jgi:DNA helicase II / ATP-dependent DNA helicase PcrA